MIKYLKKKKKRQVKEGKLSLGGPDKMHVRWLLTLLSKSGSKERRMAVVESLLVGSQCSEVCLPGDSRARRLDSINDNG